MARRETRRGRARRQRGHGGRRGGHVPEGCRRGRCSEALGCWGAILGRCLAYHHSSQATLSPYCRHCAIDVCWSHTCLAAAAIRIQPRRIPLRRIRASIVLRAVRRWRRLPLRARHVL